MGAGAKEQLPALPAAPNAAGFVHSPPLLWQEASGEETSLLTWRRDSLLTPSSEPAAAAGAPNPAGAWCFTNLYGSRNASVKRAEMETRFPNCSTSNHSGNWAPLNLPAAATHCCLPSPNADVFVSTSAFICSKRFKNAFEKNCNNVGTDGAQS